MRFITALLAACFWLILGQAAHAEDIHFELRPTFRDCPQRFDIQSIGWEEPKYQKIEFSGVYAIAFDRANSYLNRYRNQEIDDYWDHSNYSYEQYQLLVERYNNRLIDFQMGQWWNRTWRDSLPLEKGGLSRKVGVYGREFQIVDWDEVSLNTSGRIKIGDLSFLVDKTTQSNSSPTAEDLKNKTLNSITNKDVGLKASIPIDQILNNEYWNLSGQINIAIRGDTDPTKILNNIQIRVKAKLYYHKHQWGQISIQSDLSPIQNNYNCYFRLDLLFW